MKHETLQIVDDGTLDTLIHCTVCDETGRYNADAVCDERPEPVTDAEWEALDAARVALALEIAAEDHAECIDAGKAVAG